MDVDFRRWEQTDDVGELTALINRAYAPLADMGLHFVGTVQDSLTTRSRIETGDTWVAVISGRIVGTATLYLPGAKTGCSFYGDELPAVFGQFAVHPDCQGMGIGRGLVNRIASVAREAGATVLACDTSEQALDLIALYQRWGFEIVGSADWRPKVNYKSVVLARTLIGGD